MTWLFTFNPPETKKKGGKKVSNTRTGNKYRSLVKKYGVKKGVKEYKRWVREQSKGTKKSSRKAKSKGGKSMAKRATGYRALVKKHGVKKAAKMWKGKGSKKKTSKKKTKTTKSRKRASGYRSLVKKHGVQKAARMWRGKGTKTSKPKKSYKKKTYSKKTGGQWKGDKKGHSIASTAGWARRKGVPVPLYLKQKGYSKTAIDRYIGEHGAVGKHKRPYTKSYPVPTGRRYAMNPLATGIETVKAVFAMETVKTIGNVALGFMGTALGNAVVRRFKPGASTPVVVGGEIGGAILAGAVYAAVSKDTARGLLTAGSGIALSIFKVAWGKFAAGKSIFGLTMPGLSDYVELPYAADYVELPYAAGMGQALQVGMGQFLPPEAAEVGQFIPEQFGEYTVGIGEEAEVEY